MRKKKYALKSIFQLEIYFYYSVVNCMQVKGLTLLQCGPKTKGHNLNSVAYAAWCGSEMQTRCDSFKEATDTYLAPTVYQGKCWMLSTQRGTGPQASASPESSWSQEKDKEERRHTGTEALKGQGDPGTPRRGIQVGRWRSKGFQNKATKMRCRRKLTG